MHNRWVLSAEALNAVMVLKAVHSRGTPQFISVVHRETHMFLFRYFVAHTYRG